MVLPINSGSIYEFLNILMEKPHNSITDSTLWASVQKMANCSWIPVVYIKKACFLFYFNLSAMRFPCDDQGQRYSFCWNGQMNESFLLQNNLQLDESQT